jgi:hypothetical protein
MHRLFKGMLVGAVAIIAFSLLQACSGYNDERGRGDAPVEQMDDQEVRVYPNGDQFPNIAFFCVGGNGVYTTTREAPPVVNASDPECS